ncbi:MAG: CoA transferase [Candidatus Binatia bacterium]
MATGPLAHLRVVDLTDLRGALTGRILADLGADVVKVEPPGGDADRLRPPFAGNIAAPDRSLPFLFRHANKRGAMIDLGSAAGRRRLEALCDAADILVENLGADDERRTHLAPVEVRARHPHLIHVAIADLGRSGPRASWRLEPLPAFAASGALDASGFADRPPCWLPGYLAHDCAAAVAVLGALAAVLDRARHGLGQTVEVSVQEAALSALDPWAIPLADYARVYPVLPDHLRRDADGPALVLPTADGFVRVLAITPRQLEGLARLVLGRAAPEVAGEPPTHLPGRGTWGLMSRALARVAEEGRRLASTALRAAVHLPLHGSAIDALHAGLELVRTVAGEALRTRRRDEVLAQAQRLGIPMVPVHTPDEFVTAEQTRARGYFLHTGFPNLGDAPFAPLPCRLGATPVGVRRAAPTLGDDGEFDPRRPASTDPAAPPRPALAGVRVVSLGVGAVVPELCRHLADLGAEVIKIESPHSPDFLRRLTPEIDAPNRSWMFNDENRGAQSVCLDLATAEGRALALRLCAAADVVTENRQGGVVTRWGLDYEPVRALRPDVIYVSSQGFGRGGPLDTAPGFGQLAAAFAGATHLWNFPDAPFPGGTSLEHPDHFAGKLGAAIVVAALEHRRRTGVGQRIELAQTEAVAFQLGEFYLEGACTGRAAAPQGNSAPYACPHGVYQTAGDDAWVAIAVVGDAAWDGLRTALEWDAEERFATLAGRVAARAEIDARLTAWTRARAPDEVAALLQAAGVSAMPVQGPLDHRTDPHLAMRGALVTVDDPEIGPVRHVGNPVRLGRTPLVATGPAPRLGAHTAAVLEHVLGLPAAEITRLGAAGICVVAG